MQTEIFYSAKSSIPARVQYSNAEKVWAMFAPYAVLMIILPMSMRM